MRNVKRRRDIMSRRLDIVHWRIAVRVFTD